MHTKRRHEGYLLIDNRNSPGVSPELVHRAGKDAPVVGANAMYECATVTCSHCHAVVILNPDRSRPRHYCAKCDHYVCDSAGCATDCLPMNKIIDDLQNQAVHLT